VKSSAMTPRQPEVPNFMGEAAILFCAGPYCILATQIDRNKAHTRKQKVTGQEGISDTRCRKMVQGSTS
jgi:hypothetical protein